MYTRRKMMKTTALAAGSICTCHVFSALAAQSDCCNTPDLEPESYLIDSGRIRVTIKKASSLAEPGHAAYISKPEMGIELLLIRSEDDSFIAVSRFCTHGGQVLSYNHSRRLIQCNNYNHSLFELDGQVYKGPAPEPLASFDVKKEKGQLTIFLEQGDV